MSSHDARRIVFWQVHPSIHQAALARALCDLLPQGHVSCVFARRLDRERRSMGWSEPDYGGACVVFGRNGQPLLSHFEEQPDGAVHIFSSVHSEPRIAAVYRRALRRRGVCRVGLMSEGFDPRGLKGAMRRLRSVLYESRAVQSLDFLLAIGSAGEWYRYLGLPDARSFSFPYVVESAPEGIPPPGAGACAEYQIAFVGALIERKRVRDLLSALRHLDDRPWRLVVVGDGPERAALAGFAAAAGLSRRVSFIGNASNEHARRLIGASDLLVLPSRWDGWGAVVNEAFAHGVPALCSDYCGAARIVRRGVNGDVFPWGDTQALKARIQSWIAAGRLDPARRSAIRQWSTAIGGPAIAAYLLSIIAFVDGATGDRPAPPWLGAASGDRKSA